MIELKDRWGGLVLHKSDKATLKEAVVEAVASGVNLSGVNLSGADLSGVNLSGADLSGVNFYGANLSRVNFSGADLSGVNLSGSDLSRADLSGATLSGVNLSEANLSRATGICLERSSPLAMLLDQVGPIRLYKLVNAKGEGPFNGGIVYEIGKSYYATDANCDPNIKCAKGINVATLDWCLMKWQSDYRVLIVEFTRKDIACIPNGTDGKIRLHRCKVVAEKDISALVVPPVAEPVAAQADERSQ